MITVYFLEYNHCIYLSFLGGSRGVRHAMRWVVWLKVVVDR